LRAVGGFGVPEIARAFFSEQSAIRQRLVRAKQALRAQDAPFELPATAQLEARLDRVLRVLYLMFSEGHNAHQGEHAVRADVCAEAIRLTSLLVASDIGNRPRTLALLALMLLQAARLEARTDSAGELVLLEAQDRRRWNAAMVAQGIDLLARSAEGADLSDYHLEAGIAACHALGTSVAETDWQCIVEHYDMLLARNGSAVVALNRAIAIAHLHGPECGQRELRAPELAAQLNEYHLYHAAVGELLCRTNDHAGACTSFQRALVLTTNLGERNLLLRRISACQAVVSDERTDVSTTAAPSPR
jgi:RNA polymerase sigma-70 factor (ECF subfamily)